MIYVLQNLLTQAQLEILLAQLESWRLSLKAGDLASMTLGLLHPNFCQGTFWGRFQGEGICL